MAIGDSWVAIWFNIMLFKSGENLILHIIKLLAKMEEKCIICNLIFDVYWAVRLVEERGEPSKATK